MKNQILGTLLVAGALAFTLNAQVPDERRENQQERIGQGVQSGELTKGETKNLEHKEKHIKREVRRDRRENGGTLTPGEKAKVSRQQDRVSKDIAKDKHNDQVQ